jgi:prepilin-type N-terminal cleavage/methylation domain-containing protein
MEPLTTSRTSAPSTHSRQRRTARSAGFTLTEMLVVVVVIVALAAILVPLVVSSYRRAADVRSAADLQAISLALDAYRSDHGDLPRIGIARGTTGAEVLLHALIGPGDATIDGANGPGFRLRAGRGQVYGPYLEADRFQIEVTTPPLGIYARQSGSEDLGRRVIQYYAALPVAPNLTDPGAYVGVPTATVKPLYNHADNAPGGTPLYGNDGLSLEHMRRILGDTNANGQIDTGETPSHTGPYLLWAAGRDGRFGLVETDPGATGSPVHTDDITNFQIPLDLARN